MKTILPFLIAIAFTLTSCNQQTTADKLKAQVTTENKQMYVIERNIPNAGNLTAEELEGISQVSCNVIEGLGEDIAWLHSYVTNDKVFCVYTAANEDLIKEHAKKGGFPADAIVKVSSIIDPNTAK